MVSTEQAPKRGNLREIIIQHPLLAYFILTYAVTWAFLGPFVYLWRVVLDESFEWWLIIFLPGAYGPTIAALVMAHLLQGRLGIKELLSTLLIWQAHWKWYLFIAFTPVALLILAVILAGFPEFGMAEFDPVSFVTTIPFALLLALPFGPMGEELGWRGFALPRLQKRFSPFVSSLILGVIWTFWHTPMFWFPGAAIPSFLELSAFSVFLYLAQITSEATLFTVVFNNTRQSVLLAIVFHLMFNASGNILFSALPEPTYAQQLEIYTLNIVLMWIFAIVSIFTLARSSQSTFLSRITDDQEKSMD